MLLLRFTGGRGAYEFGHANRHKPNTKKKSDPGVKKGRGALEHRRTTRR